MKQISKSFANAPAEDVFRPPRDFGGSRAASEKRQQAAAVQVVARCLIASAPSSRMNPLSVGGLRFRAAAEFVIEVGF
jgi:hypothetical protein